MMQRIRTRTRLDRLSSEQRASPVRWGKRIYLAILLGLGLLVLNWAVGDALILRADGLVIADRSVAGTLYPARVARVLVREGQRVTAGDIVVELESADMLRDIAQVSAQNADLAAHEVQLTTRAVTLGVLVPLAERQARESTDVVDKLDQITATGLVSTQRLDQALTAQYDAASRLAGLHAEAAILGSELPRITQEHALAEETLRQLQVLYDHGLIRAARDGTIGPHVPASGQVVKVGDELLQIYGDQTSVVAYLPDTYLFPVSPGDEVELAGGSARATGVVEALLAVTDALPPEFQSMFRPRDRNRLVRIRLTEGESTLAVSQKVQVRGCMLGWCWHKYVTSSLLTSLWQLSLRT
jgi:multidrug resistance efflux pump